MASLLRCYGYEVTRQAGSHLRLTSSAQGAEHHGTVPAHGALHVGTLSAIVADVAAHLDREKEAVAEELFGK